jgi:hypothetical protein
VSAFGDIAICNLCEAEGRHFKIIGRDDTWAQEMSDHTAVEHMDHVEFLRGGGIYTPVIPSPERTLFVGGDD